MNKRIFAYSNLDAIPVLLGIGHLVFDIFLILIFPYAPIWLLLVLGVIYAISISWNINSISHNFIHNAYFNSKFLNRFFSLILSLANGFSQTFYNWVHMRHHSGNSDRRDKNGSTIDWLSIYRHGKNGQPENVWSYTFLSFFRDDIGEIYRSIKIRNKFNANFGIFEIICLLLLVIVGLIYNWKAVLFFLPFYYLGNCLSSLNGYYEHYKGNPDVRIAWGVSSYNKLYNIIWLNNGYHAEHHFRPKMHWTKMKKLHQEIKQDQVKAKVHVISHCHALGFLQ